MPDPQQQQKTPDFIPAEGTPDFIPTEEEPKEGAVPRFMHGAGLPGTRVEYEHLLPSADWHRGQFDAGTLLKGVATPQASTVPGAQQTSLREQEWPVVGPLFRGAAETAQRKEHPIMAKTLALLPGVGPPAYQSGIDFEKGNYAGMLGDITNEATQLLGLRPAKVPIARATADIAAPVVRGVAKGVNRTLEHAPGTVGAGLGAAAAHEAGIPPWIGAGAGYGLGREILPKLRVPGEKVGLGPKAPNPSFLSQSADRFLRSPGIEGEAPVATESTASPWSPSPYRLKSSQITEPTTITPRRVLGTERQLPPHLSEEPPAEPQSAPLKAKTLAGQNAEVLKRSGIAGPKSTLKPLAEIPKGELAPDPHYDFQHVRSGEQAITQQISSHPLNKLRAIATQRGIKVEPSDTNNALIKKISDSATPAEIDAFEQARIERMHPNYAPSPREASPGVEPVAPQGGHAGGGSLSVEELNRPGKNYVVTKNGIVSAHGKLFDPGSTPRGGSHVTVLPNGDIRVNAGHTLTLSQETALRKVAAQ